MPIDTEIGIRNMPLKKRIEIVFVTYCAKRGFVVARPGISSTS